MPRAESVKGRTIAQVTAELERMQKAFASVVDAGFEEEDKAKMLKGFAAMMAKVPEILKGVTIAAKKSKKEGEDSPKAKKEPAGNERSPKKNTYQYFMMVNKEMHKWGASKIRDEWAAVKGRKEVKEHWDAKAARYNADKNLRWEDIEQPEEEEEGSDEGSEEGEGSEGDAATVEGPGDAATESGGEEEEGDDGATESGSESGDDEE